MTKLRVVVLLAVVVLLLFPAMAFAQMAPPDFPCRFHGTVTVDGQPVADGTAITATVGNETYTTVTATTESDGPSAYEVKIIPPEGADFTGKIVTFMIGADSAKETAIFEDGGNIELPLSVGEAPTPVDGVITDVEVYWTEGDSTVIGGTLYLYLGEQPEGPKGDKGDPGAPGAPGEAGEDAAGGIALPIVAIVIAVIAAGMAIMSMRRRV